MCHPHPRLQVSPRSGRRGDGVEQKASTGVLCEMTPSLVQAREQLRVARTFGENSKGEKRNEFYSYPDCCFPSPKTRLSGFT